MRGVMVHELNFALTFKFALNLMSGMVVNVDFLQL